MLVLATAGCLAAGAVAVRLGRSLEASERNLARAEERIRALEREAEEGRDERARLTDELDGSKRERARLRAELAAAQREDGAAEAFVLDYDDDAAAESAGATREFPGVAPESAPPDPRPAREEREELFGAHAPAVETMLTLYAEERFEQLAALAEAEIARDPDFTFAWLQGGLAYARLGDLERARERLLVARERAQDADARLAPYYRAAWFALEELAP